MGDGTTVSRKAPPRSLPLRYSAAGSLPPAKYNSLRPSPSQSNAATPPPTKYWKSPEYWWSMTPGSSTKCGAATADGSGWLVASRDWYGNCEGDCDGAVAKSAHRSD